MTSENFSAARNRAEGNLVIFMISGAFFSTVSVNYVISPVLPNIAQAFQVSISMAALLVSIYGLFYGCFALVVGPVGDYWGRKLMMCSALMVFSVMTVLCGLAPSFNWLLIFRAAAATAAAALQPATWAYLADYFPFEKRGTAAAWVMQAGSLALIMGVPIGGLIARFLDWRWVFIVAAMAATAITLAIIIWLPSFDKTVREKSQQRGRMSSILSITRKAYGALLANTAARSALVVSFLIWFAFFGLYTYVGAFLKYQFGLNSADIGFVTLALGIGYILGGQLGGRLSDLVGRRRVILAGLGVLTFVLAVLLCMNSLPLVVIGIFAMGFAYFFTYSAQVTLITELVPQARSTAMSINYFSTYIGMTAGSAITGAILARFDFPYLGLMSAVACVVAAVVAERFVFVGRSEAVTT